jgi:hypothetical protein
MLAFIHTANTQIFHEDRHTYVQTYIDDVLAIEIARVGQHGILAHIGKQHEIIDCHSRVTLEALAEAPIRMDVYAESENITTAQTHDS